MEIRNFVDPNNTDGWQLVYKDRYLEIYVPRDATREDFDNVLALAIKFKTIRVITTIAILTVLVLVIITVLNVV